jgi:hypothetical protein
MAPAAIFTYDIPSFIPISVCDRSDPSAAQADAQLRARKKPNELESLSLADRRRVLETPSFLLDLREALFCSLRISKQ